MSDIRFINPDTGAVVWVAATKEDVDLAYAKGWMPASAEEMDRADEVSES